MEYLGKRYDGTLHSAALIEEDDDDDSDNEVVEMHVKSQETLIAERCAGAKAKGNVLFIAATTVSTKSSSI